MSENEPKGIKAIMNELKGPVKHIKFVHESADELVYCVTFTEDSDHTGIGDVLSRFKNRVENNRKFGHKSVDIEGGSLENIGTCAENQRFVIIDKTGS